MNSQTDGRIDVNTCETGARSGCHSPWCNVVLLVRKEGWEFVLLHWLLLTQHMHEDGFISNSTYTRGDGEPSRSRTLLLSWPKVRFLAAKMHKESKQYTAFTVWNLGFFKCGQMPFGLCNTPATFKWLRQNCLGKLNLTYCLIYLDDVIVFWKREEEYLHHLCVVFDQFCEHNLKLKLTNCEFFRSKINYLGHHVSKNGVRPSQDNLKVIVECAWHWSGQSPSTSRNTFIVGTDESSLTCIMTTPNLDATRHCWVDSLAQYPFNIE